MNILYEATENMACQHFSAQSISFDTTGDEIELIHRFVSNQTPIMVSKDKELMGKQKEFFEKIHDIALAKCDGNR